MGGYVVSESDLSEAVTKANKLTNKQNPKHRTGGTN